MERRTAFGPILHRAFLGAGHVLNQLFRRDGGRGRTAFGANAVRRIGKDWKCNTRASFVLSIELGLDDSGC